LSGFLKTMKLISTKLFKRISGKNPVIALIFLVFLLSSPWYTVILTNLYILPAKDIHPLNLNDQVIIYQIDSDRGELIRSGVPGPISKLLINKVTYYSYEIMQRYFETFDPKYLFFTGDLDTRKSIQSSGPIYLSFLPPILTGIYTSLVGKRKVILLLFATPTLGAMVQAHYETISRIPALIVLTYFAAIGLVYIFGKNRRLAFPVLILMFFEFVRFGHNFLVHYPSLFK
jgi:hypothetical protein